MAQNTNIGLQGLGGIMSLAQAIPTKQDRLMGGLAQGKEDPAVAALRASLARQNAQTAMSVAASAQGVNPALASRQAQQSLAQSQAASNAELARAGISSAQQARQRDRKGERRDAGLTAAGKLLNTLGTGLATQEAGLAAGESAQGLAAPQPQVAQAQAPLQATPETAAGLSAPPQGSIPTAAQPPVVQNGTVPLPAPAPQPVSYAPAGQMQMQGGGIPQQPALGPQPAPDYGLSGMQPEMGLAGHEERPIDPVASGVVPADLQTQPRVVSQQRIAPPAPMQPSMLSSLPPEALSDPVNANTLASIQQYEANGNMRAAEILLSTLQAR